MACRVSVCSSSVRLANPLCPPSDFNSSLPCPSCRGLWGAARCVQKLMFYHHLMVLLHYYNSLGSLSRIMLAQVGVILKLFGKGNILKCSSRNYAGNTSHSLYAPLTFSLENKELKKTTHRLYCTSGIQAPNEDSNPKKCKETPDGKRAECRREHFLVGA